MKPAASLLPMFAAAAASLVLCAPGFADIPQTINLTIENHQKLVTVKDDSGKWVFAQVIPTSDLKLSQVSLDKNLTRISLLDTSGKTLWSKTANCAISGISPNGEWSKNFLPTMAAFGRAVTTLVGKDASASSFGSLSSVTFIIGPEDQLLSLHAVGGKHQFDIVPNKIGFAAKMDGSNLLVVLPQQPS